MSKMIVSEATKQHLLAHGDVLSLAETVFDTHDKHGTLFPFTPLMCEFNVDVGKSECIEVERVEDDTPILVQRRIGRDRWSRAVECSPVPCKAVTIIIGKNDNLITAYVGYPAPREPWDKSMDKYQKSESVEFWRNHALCLQPGAVTSVMTYREFCNG